MVGPALASRKPGITARLRASKRRQQQAADKLVYQQVDERDGLRSRLSGEYGGYDIERHHIRPRSLGGLTTVQNVISLLRSEHAAIHAGELKLEGNAEWSMAGRLCGVQVYRKVDGQWCPQELI